EVVLTSDVAVDLGEARLVVVDIPQVLLRQARWGHSASRHRRSFPALRRHGQAVIPEPVALKTQCVVIVDVQAPRRLGDVPLATQQGYPRARPFVLAARVVVRPLLGLFAAWASVE